MRKTKVWALIITVVFSIATFGCGSSTAKTQTGGLAQTGAPVTIKVLDIGQGDAILIRTQEQVTLIDTGDVPQKDRIVALLKQEGVKTIDNLIITHPHADHLGGAGAIFTNFIVKHVYDSGQQTTTALYRQYLAAIKKHNIPFSVLTTGQEIAIGGGAVLHILHPADPYFPNEKGDGTDLNNNSIVARLTYGNFAMLLSGDAEELAEKRILESKAVLKSQVLKVGHHGSKTSSSPEFLKAVAPETVIISVGANNDYHHPHPSTLKKFESLKFKVFRTDLNGTVAITTDGNSYQVVKEK